MMRIDPYSCTCCGVCEVVCPYDAIRGNSNRYFIKSEDCYYCGWCKDVCPVDAIVEEE